MFRKTEYKKRFPGIDIAKFVFACLIPSFHIGFPSTLGIYVVREYIARCGVPIFFTISGFFLADSRQNRGKKCALIHFEKRIGIMLLAWTVIYLPLLIPYFAGPIDALQQLLFMTPAFLWYLTAMLFAAIPFCLISNRKFLWTVSAVLYIIGVLLSDSYSWLTGGFPTYEKIFLTTRNGLFFALPLMCIGELVQSQKNKIKCKWAKLITAVFFLYAEITFVQMHAESEADTSMYFILPIVCFYLLELLIDIRTNRNTQEIGQISSAIYVIQYGIIFVAGKLFSMLSISPVLTAWYIYALVLTGGIILQRIVKKFPKLKFLI